MQNQLKRRSDGTIQHKRVQQTWPKNKPFKILSIDGGGIRGVFPVAYLAELEKRFLDGKSIVGHFDMVAGTSTGGIITLGLGKGMTAQKILSIFTERGYHIFPTKSKFIQKLFFLNTFFNPKHDQNILENELKNLFGATQFGESKCRCVIPSFDGRFGEPVIYKTPHHPDYKFDKYMSMIDIGLHTSAAPTMFPAVHYLGYVMIDGGIWANNPIMNALVDVLACFSVPRENVRILSIGTGEETFSMKKPTEKGGRYGWCNPMVLKSVVFRAQSKNALGQAFLLIGKDNIVRIDIPESETLIAVDNVKRSVKELPNVARALVEGSGHLINDRFFNEPALPFKPVNPE